MFLQWVAAVGVYFEAGAWVAGGAARLAACEALFSGVGVSVGAEWGGESWSGGGVRGFGRREGGEAGVEGHGAGRLGGNVFERGVGVAFWVVAEAHCLDYEKLRLKTEDEDENREMR
jgi:hypothetical protein